MSTVTIKNSATNVQYDVLLGGTKFDDLLVELRPEDSDAFATAAILGTAGASQTGSIANLTKRNGILWTITEGGAAGRMFELTFEDISQVPAMIFTGIYTGSIAHASNLTWRAYNYVNSNWDDVLTFTWANATQYNEVTVAGFTSQHISTGGQVRVAVNHASTIVGGHTLALDAVRLVQDNQPASVYFRGGRANSYRNTGFDVLHYKGQLSHAYKAGTNLLWHVHFSTWDDIPDGQTISFRTNLSIASPFQPFPVEIPLTATFTNDSTTRAAFNINNTSGVIPAYEHLIVPCLTQVSGSGLTLSAIVLGEVVRLAGTFTPNVAVLFTDFHFEKDDLGSTTEFVK